MIFKSIDRLIITDEYNELVMQLSGKLTIRKTVDTVLADWLGNNGDIF